MKRRTYRRAKKELEREKKQEKQKKSDTTLPPFSQADQVPETSFTQDTAEFDVDAFSEPELPTETYTDLDTNEIFFERQKDKQFLWSGPSGHQRQIAVLVIIIIAIIAIVTLGPTVFSFFQTMFK